jgi:hypothetical protein
MAKSSFGRGAIVIGATLIFVGCNGTGSNSSDGSSSGAVADSPAGVVIGPLDHHCVSGDGGLTVQTIGVCDVDDPGSVPSNAASCGITFDRDAGTSDAGTPDAGAADLSDYGPTMYGSAGNDDDCKYFISWVATPIVENQGTYFTVTAVRLSDMQPATCAGIRADTSLSINHGAPPPADPAPEIAPGVYKVGPIKFDTKGRWTERFHLFEECNDGPEDSPHGHAAFYIDVP